MLGLDNTIGQKMNLNPFFSGEIIMHCNSFEIHYNNGL